MMPPSTSLYRSVLAIVPLGVALLLGAPPAVAVAQQQSGSRGEATAADATDSTPRSESPEKDGAPNNSTERNLLKEADSIAAKVGAFRGLALEAKIHKGLRNRDQLRRILITRLDEEVSDEEVLNEAKVLIKLGLLPADLNYRQTLLDVLTEQIAGFYDQHAKELYIMEGIPRDLQRPAMAHEIFHAIQDQHFDINRMVEPLSNQQNSDFALARSALIEGDASMVMIDFSLYEKGVLPHGDIQSVIDIPMMATMLKKLTGQDIGALQKLLPDDAPDTVAVDPNSVAQTALGEAPRVLQKLLTFPYFAGMQFIIDARSDHDWQRVNAIYKNPPVSTEQILHPERYFAGDDPTLLDFKTAPVISPDNLIYDTVLGEYQMRLFLEEHLVDPKVKEANAHTIDRAMLGWGGDRLRAYELEPGEVVLAHLSAWDAQLDAAEYFDALVQVMKARYPQAEFRQSHGRYGRSVCIVANSDSAASVEAERIYLEQWGDLVLQLEGVPTQLDDNKNETDPTAAMLRDQIMHSVERTAFAEDYRQKLKAYDAEHARTAAQPKDGE